MGSLDIYMPTDLINQLEKLDNYDEVAGALLEEASPELVFHVQKGIRRVVSDNSTGELADSMESTKPSKNKYGYFIVVRPTGKDKNGVRNGAKLAYLEYGHHLRGKDGNKGKFINPKPSLVASIKEAQSACTEIMEKKFEEIINS